MASITENIERIIQAKEDIRKSLLNMGIASIPEGTPIDRYAQYIEGNGDLVGMKFFGIFPDNRVDFESHNFVFPYIDLNIRGGRDTDFEIEFEDATWNFYFFGAWWGNYNNRVFACGNDVFELYSGWGYDGGGQGLPVTKGTLRLAGGKLYLNGEVIREFNDNGNDFDSGHIYIGAQNRKGSLGYPEDFGAEYSCVVTRFTINGVEYTPYIDENGVGCFRNRKGDFYFPEQGTLEPVFA